MSCYAHSPVTLGPVHFAEDRLAKPAYVPETGFDGPGRFALQGEIVAPAADR